MAAVRLSVVACVVQCVLSIKLGSYNTFQLPSNSYASSLAAYQLAALSASDIDVLCLQELYLPNTTIEYLATLAEFGNYTDSFSMLDVLAPSDLSVPRAPCLNSSVPEYLTSDCSDTNCRTYYDDYGSGEGYLYCMAQACPDETAQILFTECTSCVGAFITIHGALSASGYAAALGYPDLNLEAGIDFCEAPLSNPLMGLNFDEYLFNNTDGIAIASRFPIVNTWSVELPAWLFVPKRVALAEIDVCSETRPNDADCEDSIIVGCTHLHSGIDIFDDVGIVQSPLLDVDWVTSNNGLNRYQTQYVLDNLFNEDLLDTLGRQDEADSILGVFLMGDMNNGQMFDRCSYNESAVDNCEDPSNQFDLFAAGGMMDAPDFVQSLDVDGAETVELLCTWCLDDSRDDFNEMCYEHSLGRIISVPEASCNVDHVLVQQGYEQNMVSAMFEREFTEAIVEGVNPFGINGSVTMSDHYGVSLTIEFAEPTEPTSASPTTASPTTAVTSRLARGGRGRGGRGDVSGRGGRGDVSGRGGRGDVSGRGSLVAGFGASDAAAAKSADGQLDVGGELFGSTSQLSYKDALIGALIATNLIIMAYFVYCAMTKRCNAKHKYVSVVDEESDREKLNN